MKFKFLLRPLLALIFAILGVVGIRAARFADIFQANENILLVIGALSFAILGYILPDILELTGKAGIAALARQLVRYLPSPPSPNLRVPRMPFRKNSSNNQKHINPLVIDTSALIDGRIVDIVKTGFIYGTFLILPSVVSELHNLADGSNDLKRARARRGLDYLSELQKVKFIKVLILKSEPEGRDVDDKLVEFAQKIKGKIVTLDFNLNKVAKVNRVAVLNVNELASAVKTAVLPNDRLTLQIIAEGRGKDQGVGYLEDGTMVVVEYGSELVGDKVEVIVQRVLQTEAGKMIFAKIP